MSVNAQELPAGYDPYQRPDPSITPTQVIVNIYVYDIIEISDVDRTCTIDFFITVDWHDPRLAVKAGDSGNVGRTLPLEKIWNPQLLLANQRELEKKQADEVLVKANGDMHYNQRFTGTIIFGHDLHDFPLDRHELGIMLVARGYDSTEVNLVGYNGTSGQSKTFSIADWDIDKGYVKTGNLYIAPRNKHFQTWSYFLPVSRQAGFYLWKVIVPLCLIIFMSWTVFLIRPDQVGAQIGISTASVLTLIIFQFSLSELVPKVSYLTRIDQFSIGAIILVFLALLESIYTVMLWVKQKEALSMKMDRWSLIIFPILFIFNIVNAFLI
jgi:hypothetical protein